MQSSSQNQSMNDLLNQLKTYEEREKAFKTHLKMKDIEIQKLEKAIGLNHISYSFNNSTINEEETEIFDSEEFSIFARCIWCASI